MNKFKARTRFKRFVNQMSKMILKLLGSLNIKEVHKKGSEAAYRYIFILFMLINFFNSQLHVPTNSTHFFVLLHM